MTPSDDAAWDTIAAERRAFADVLDTLTPEQWAARSLCGAWTVKEVVVHTMVGPTGTTGGFVTAMVAGRGRFDRANQVMVARRAQRPASEVVADLRDHATSRFRPPTFDWRAPYTDLMVHRLDALVPLGVDPGRPVGLWSAALDFLLSRKARGAFVPGAAPALTYAATDLAWSAGSGPRVEAPAATLGLALTGRASHLDGLAGPGAPTLRRFAAGKN